MNTLAFRLTHHKELAHHWAWVVRMGAVIIAAGLLLGLSYVAVQFYPAGRLAPRSNLSGIPIGNMNHEQAVARLEEAALEERQVELYIDSEVVTASYSDLGVVFDLEKSVNETIRQQESMKRYGDSAWKFWNPEDGTLSVELDKEKFAKFLTKDLSDYQEPPADAWIIIKDGQATIKPEKTAWRISEEDFKNSLLRAAGRLDSSVPVAIHKEHPEIRADQLGAQARTVQAALDMNLRLTYKGDSYPVPAKEQASWLVIVADREGMPMVSVDGEKLKGYLGEVAKNIDKDPVPHLHRLHDGSVRSTTDGKAGYRLDVDSNAAKIKEAISKAEPETEVVLTVETIKPIVNYHRTYSRSSKGINTLLSDFTNERWGQYGLRFEGLSGDIIAGHNPNKSFVTASTYKFFLAYAVYHEIENGRLEPTDPTPSGSVAYCLREMIIYSTNPCATALGNKVGWKRVDSILDAAGLKNTRLNNYGPRLNKYTTASDAASLLRMLEEGSLINSTHRKQLLGYMKTQIYRSGTPAGFSRLPVANKIGFLEGYLHDIAIVYGRKDTYILAGYSYGGSFAEFAELSRRLKAILE